jgi:hypothetical protein
MVQWGWEGSSLVGLKIATKFRIAITADKIKVDNS